MYVLEDVALKYLRLEEVQPLHLYRSITLLLHLGDDTLLTFEMCLQEGLTEEGLEVLHKLLGFTGSDSAQELYLPLKMAV